MSMPSTVCRQPLTKTVHIPRKTAHAIAYVQLRQWHSNADIKVHHLSTPVRHGDDECVRQRSSRQWLQGERDNRVCFDICLHDVVPIVVFFVSSSSSSGKTSALLTSRSTFYNRSPFTNFIKLSSSCREHLSLRGAISRSIGAVH